MSFGRKPWPGGAWKVCLMLERMRAGFVPVVDLLEGVGEGCEMMPTPSLLAEPSRPRAIIFV